jgi:hypothetical protein
MATGLQLGEPLERVADGGVVADDQDVVRLALLPQVDVVAAERHKDERPSSLVSTRFISARSCSRALSGERV